MENKNKIVIYRASLIWLGLFILAFVNGAFREFGFKKFLSESGAHQLSCLTGAILWSILVWSLWEHSKIKTYAQAIAVGLYWFFLTILTETFLLNKLMGKMTWEQILKTYDISSGEYWGLVLIWIGVLPYAVRFLKIRFH